MKASSQVIYLEIRKRWITQREGRSSFHRRSPRHLFLALALSPAVQHREAVTKASLLIPSWIFLPLLRHHLSAYDIQALILRRHPSHAPPTGIEFPRISLNIRPLPQIPQSAVEPGTRSSMLPTLPQRAVRPHAQSIPSLHVRTEVDHRQTLPRSVSTTTPPPISAVSGGHMVPNIVVHPSSLLRTHPRTSSVISPTESVPVTVSDIHFRHSSDDEPGEPESRRTSTAVSEHPPPHPPLPQRSYTSPFIMHKLFGTPEAPPTAPGGGQFSQQSPGAGPSRLRDRDPPSAGPSARQKK